MNLTYTDLTSNFMLDDLQKINYLRGTAAYDSDKHFRLVLQVKPNFTRLYDQTDVFSEQMMTMRSKIDYKRFMGSNDKKWQANLCELYIYSYVKGLFYGLYGYNVEEYPNDSKLFLGHGVFSYLLTKRQYIYFSNNENDQYSVESLIDMSKVDRDKLFDEVISVFPFLSNSVTRVPGSFCFFDSKYEAMLEGIVNSVKYHNNRKDSIKIDIQITELGSNSLAMFTPNSASPLLNGFTNLMHSKFYFTKNSSSNVRWNESIFLPRALCICARKIPALFNNLPYYIVEMANQADHLTKEDVYSVTGLKCNTIPKRRDGSKRIYEINMPVINSQEVDVNTP